MVEKVQRKNPPVTIARMIKLKRKKQPTCIPPEFFENFKPEDTKKRWAIMILAPATKIIRIIPTKSSKVLKLKIEYSNTDFLAELGEYFIKNSIKMIYSTGICPRMDVSQCPYGMWTPCPFYMYVDSFDLPISEDQLKSELCAKSSINNVEIAEVDT
ncbi:MAG: hypothetical protein ACFE95_00135 [Candidatus Hodarchaeota archaeon]